MDDAKSLMRRFVDEFQNKGNEAVAHELLAETFIDHTTTPEVFPGKEGVKAFVAMFRRAVPDLRAQVHDMLAEGDKIATRKNAAPTRASSWACRRPGTRSRSTPAPSAGSDRLEPARIDDQVRSGGTP